MKITPEMVREAEAHFPFALAEGPTKGPRWQWFADFYNHALENPGAPCPCCNITPDGDIMDHLPEPPEPGASTEPWPRFILDEALVVLRNVDTQFRATGQPSARVERLINLLAGMQGRTAAQPPAEAQPVGEVKLHGGLLYGQLDRDLPQGTKIYAHPPPSAPVGVEGPARRLLEAYDDNAHPFEAAAAAEELRNALAQQPTPVAPVGVEGLAAAGIRRCGRCKRDGNSADCTRCGGTGWRRKCTDLDCHEHGCCGGHTCYVSPEEVAALAQQPAAEAQAVGEAEAMPGTNGGFTAAVFKAADVPVGTKLYTAPPSAPEAQGGGEVAATVVTKLGRNGEVGEPVVMLEPAYEAWLDKQPPSTSHKLYTTPPSAPVEPYTYASRQATTCAGCGEHKHTPLRIDAMGGYVCLTCIDQKLGSLLDEFGYVPSAPVGVEKILAEMREEGQADIVDGGVVLEWEDDLRNALAQQPAARQASDECPVCHRAWTEHRIGYSASSCRIKPQQASTPVGVERDPSHAWPAVDRVLTDAYSAGADGHDFDLIAARRALAGEPTLAQQPAAVDDSALLDALASEYWKLDPFDMPTPGGDDADVGWRVIQYHRGHPHEREVAVHYGDDPRAALRAALAAQQGGGSDER